MIFKLPAKLNRCLITKLKRTNKIKIIIKRLVRPNNTTKRTKNK